MFFVKTLNLQLSMLKYEGGNVLQLWEDCWVWEDWYQLYIYFQNYKHLSVNDLSPSRTVLVASYLLQKLYLQPTKRIKNQVPIIEHSRLVDLGACFDSCEESDLSVSSFFLCLSQFHNYSKTIWSSINLVWVLCLRRF